MRECSQENAWNFDKWPIWKAITWERALIHFLWNQEPFSDSSDSFSDIDPNFKFKSLFFWTSIFKWTSYCSDAFCTLILMMKSFSTFIKILTVDTDNLNLKIPRFRNTTVLLCIFAYLCVFCSHFGLRSYLHCSTLIHFHNLENVTIHEREEEGSRDG